ncbi:vesicle transport protein SFT2B, putative [Entamoeba invadens IP1]|uniref:vesicle transport protein SFT2B, putative n=1 Tax=Entamoeba invadens IP1 TaxID=370355 RepID=UPI0002C3EBB4|nr:vesicle transport protein SFT2B, putative [Entamoeba invadens IP1]ELP85332.1 vesicle transport protein SFT2B, putative [Entamoeba invadens IP1]|eukprot:XP_004184678.1 vesicle transport protein SFT2B, putative [Entamoeba invadens IP1]
MNFVNEDVLLDKDALNETAAFTVEEPCQCLELSLRTRIFGFLITFTIGGTLLIICIPLLGTVLVAPTVFAIVYTIAISLIFCSMFFLYGPKQQFNKLISSPLRFIAFLICLATTIFTLFCVFKFRFLLVIIISIILQLAASSFYGFSLLPFAQNIWEKCTKGRKE